MKTTKFDDLMKEYDAGLLRNIRMYLEVLTQDHGKTGATLITLMIANGTGGEYEQHMFRILDKPKRFPQYASILEKYGLT